MNNNISLKKQKLSIDLFFITSLVALLYFFGYRRQTPIPYLTNWDWLHHLVLIKQIMNGRFSLFLNKISDTFTVNSYPPVFHLIIAAFGKITQINLLQIVWWSELIHFWITSLASYWIGMKIFNSRLGGFLTAIISMLVFESTVVYTTFFLLPQTVAGTLGALFLIWLITKNGKISFTVICFTGFVVLMFHYLIGAIYIFLGLILFFIKKLNLYRFRKILITTVIFFFILSLTLGLFNQKIILSDRPDAQHFIYNFKQLSALFTQWYGFLPLFLIPLGLFYLQKTNPNSWLVIFLSFILTALSFFPFSYALKIYALGRYFTNLIIAAGIFVITNQFKNPVKKFFVLTLFFISTAMVFSTNLNSHLQLSYNGKQSSYISDADFSAADWINKNYLKQKVFLVSDPSTQAVFEALTDVNTQGGAFPQENTVKLIGSLAWEKSPSVIYKTIKKIHDRLIDQDKKDITIFIMGGRYFRWQKFDWDCKLNYACQSWLPLKIKAADQLLIKKLSDSNYFKVVYQNEENVILELVK